MSRGQVVTCPENNESYKTILNKARNTVTEFRKTDYQKDRNQFINFVVFI